MIKKQFVTRKIAILLEEVGCDERFGDDFGAYYYSDVNLVYCSAGYFDVWPERKFVKAPPWQQVISWFATKHNIYIYVLRTMKTTEEFEFLYIVEEWGDDDMVCDYTDYFKTYEEAREAAILEAIKIVKGDKQ